MKYNVNHFIAAINDDGEIPTDAEVSKFYVGEGHDNQYEPILVSTSGKNFKGYVHEIREKLTNYSDIEKSSLEGVTIVRFMNAQAFKGCRRDTLVMVEYEDYYAISKIDGWVC
jgi:hypothetical protein